MTIDNLLIENLRSDDQNAFEEIYNCYGPQLINYACARLASIEEARDLVQDIFVRFYERREVLNIEVSIRAYLFAALKYKMIDHIRKNANKKFYEEMLVSLRVESSEDVFDHMVYNNLTAIVNEEVDRLPQRVKETFILSRRRNMSVQEIATEMKVSEQTVKNQLSTAIKKLRFVIDRIAIIGFVYSITLWL